MSKVTKAWTRATAPGQDSASVQLTIISKKDATLIGVASGSAQSGEIHTMFMDGDVMKMRAIESLPLPAKDASNTGCGRQSSDVDRLKAPLKAGRKLPFALTVKFADGKNNYPQVLAVIKPMDTASSDGQMQMQMKPAPQPEAAMHQHEHPTSVGGF